jgi:hypothetical protein
MGRAIMVGLVVAILIVGALVAVELGGAGGTGSSSSAIGSDSSSSHIAVTSSSSGGEPGGASSSSTGVSGNPSVTQSQGGPLQITVLKAISDPPEALAGGNAYIYDVTLTGNGAASYQATSTSFTLIVSTGVAYNSTLLKAMRQPLTAAALSHGQVAIGQVAFQVPGSQLPLELEFKDQADGIDEFTSLPQPTAWVSEPTIGNIVLTGSQSGELFASLSFANDTQFFYSGEVIALELTINGIHNTGEVAIKTLSLSGPDKTLSVSSIDPQLPLVVTVCCSDVDTFQYYYVYLYIFAPASSFVGAISVNGTTD